MTILTSENFDREVLNSDKMCIRDRRSNRENSSCAVAEAAPFAQSISTRRPESFPTVEAR